MFLKVKKLRDNVNVVFWSDSTVTSGEKLTILPREAFIVTMYFLNANMMYVFHLGI